MCNDAQQQQQQHWQKHQPFVAGSSSSISSSSSSSTMSSSTSSSKREHTPLAAAAAKKNRPSPATRCATPPPPLPATRSRSRSNSVQQRTVGYAPSADERSAHYDGRHTTAATAAAHAHPVDTPTVAATAAAAILPQVAFASTTPPQLGDHNKCTQQQQPTLAREASTSSGHSMRNARTPKAADDKNSNVNNNNNNSRRKAPVAAAPATTTTTTTTTAATTNDSHSSSDEITQTERRLLRTNSVSARSVSPSATLRTRGLSHEDFQFAPALKSDEIQVLFHSPNDDLHTRSQRDEQAKRVLPDKSQSPIALYSNADDYEQLVNKPLVFEYPAGGVENLRISNTGLGWQVKLPFQQCMQTTLTSAALFGGSRRFKLDQFHCHWSTRELSGSEHSVDDRFYSAELHFVHYDADKYPTMSMASRHADGLCVVAVFLDAQRANAPHAELEKVLLALRQVKFKSEHAVIREPIKLAELLPSNKSYWHYFGSLTTPPYYESVQWLVLKQPLRCSRAQTIDRFEQITSSLRADDAKRPIACNCRPLQPRNNRRIASYNDNSRL